MGMCSYVKGVRDLDGQFAKMMAVKFACEAANIQYPAEVTKYFKSPGESREDLEKEMAEVDITPAVMRDSKESQEWWDVDLSKLPKEVKVIRFVNSY